jgi:RNA polymerase sigma factor (sigma-70 family)
MEAARTFDPSKSKFCTWATRLVMQRLVDEFHRNARLKESSSPDLDSRPEEVHESLPLHLLPDILGEEGDDRSMVIGHYIEGKSLSDLGREFGYSKEWIRKKIQSAVSKMRRDNFAILEAYL